MSQLVNRDRAQPTSVLPVIRSALELGGSLVFTWSIALAIRLLIPRYLGPARFGALSFADAFTATFFVTLNLGIDTYVRKEVAVRPAHASDFFGGTVILRGVMTACIFGGMSLLLWAIGRPADVWMLVFLYGFTQVFVTANATLSAMLHARGRVSAMSVLAVATKVIWAAGILVTLATGAGLWAYGASYLASESVETVVLYGLARRHLGLVYQVDRPATTKMMRASLPYYLTIFATTAYGKLDVSVLDFVGNSQEVGWYGAASAVAGLTLLITPLIGWVLMPMFARAAARSRAELFEHLRRSMELILSVAIPASLVINLGADLWFRVIFGAAFAPAATALRILATMFVLTYVAIVYAQALTMLDRAWTLTKISTAGLFVNVALNLLLIRRSMSTLGPGGGGAGCALAMMGTEVFVTSLMMLAVGREAFDRRSTLATCKSLAAYAVVTVLHVLLRSLGPSRLVLDVVVYGALVVGTGALRPGRIARAVADSLRNRQQRADAVIERTAASLLPPGPLVAPEAVPVAQDDP